LREIEPLTQQLADRDATIRDLRTRLDDSEAERRRVQERLTGAADAPAGRQRAGGWQPKLYRVAGAVVAAVVQIGRRRSVSIKGVIGWVPVN
jgi:hypothetical protein